MNRIIKVLVVGLGYIALEYHSGHAVKDGYKSVPEVDNRPGGRIIRAQMKPNISFQIVEELKRKHSPEKFKAMVEAATKSLEEDAARGFFYREEIEKAKERVMLERKREMERRAILEEMARSKREREQGNHTPTAVAH